MTRVSTFVVLVVVAGCAAPRTVPEAQEEVVNRALTADERRALDPLIAFTESVRGLRFTRSFNARAVNGLGMREHTEPELDQRAIERMERLYRALGLFTPTDRLREIYLESIEGVPDAFSSTDDTMLLREERLPMLGLATNAASVHRLHVVHELVHALQFDPSFHSTVMPSASRAPGTWDAERAARSLVEGDADFSMLVAYARIVGADPMRLARESLSITAFERFLAAGEHASDNAVAEIPVIVRGELIGPYEFGWGYVRHVYAEGGWSAVNARHAAPPRSMEQVMHPYLEGPTSEPEIANEAARALFENVVLASGYEAVLADTFGELGMALFFADVTGAVSPWKAAEGWSGDFVSVYARDGAADIATWVSTWDSIRDAVEAAEAARQVATLKASRGHTLRVVRIQRTVLITFEVPEALDEDMRRALHTYAYQFLDDPAAPIERE